MWVIVKNVSSWIEFKLERRRCNAKEYYKTPVAWFLFLSLMKNIVYWTYLISYCLIMHRLILSQSAAKRLDNIIRCAKITSLWVCNFVDNHPVNKKINLYVTDLVKILTIVSTVLACNITYTYNIYSVFIACVFQRSFAHKMHQQSFQRFQNVYQILPSF